MSVNSLYMLKPSWKKENLGGYVGGALVIYCESEEQFLQYFKEAAFPSYRTESFSNYTIERYFPKKDAELAYYIKNLNPRKGFSDNIGEYWFVIGIVPAFLPQTKFGIIIHETHDG